MKITLFKLKQIIKEEMQRSLNENAGGFEWPLIEDLLSDPKKDLIETLQEMGKIITTNYHSEMEKYNMGSMDFAYDILDNYEEELRPYREEYPDVDMVSILDSAIERE